MKYFSDFLGIYFSKRKKYSGFLFLEDITKKV